MRTGTKMTAATATNFTISHTIDQVILDDLETAFDGFRSRIAVLSVETCGTVTSMFSPMAPILSELIDIPAIEWEQFELALVPANDDEAVAEMVAA